MPGDEAVIHENPIVVPAARRLSLVVAAGTPEERTVVCRRVITLIGSRPGCKITLQHKRIAAVHLAIINEGGRITALDLITKHGTLLNGLALQHEELADGDILTVQKYDFGVRIREPHPEGNADVHPFPLDESPRVALEQATTQRLFQPKRDVCIIGRRPGCDIALADPDVSRVHALLLTYFGRPAVFDLLSTNRTFVNDEPVHFKLLSRDDLITVGEERFYVRFTNKLVRPPAGKNGSPPKKPETAEPESQTLKTVELMEPLGGDLVDIHSTESVQRWRIVDKMEKLAKSNPAPT